MSNSDLNPAYFQYLDRLLGILQQHGIVPVLQPVFQGFGWKGLDVAGTVVPPREYARYCRYLVARYGARPAVCLVGADGSGRGTADRGGRPGGPRLGLLRPAHPASTTGRTRAPPRTRTRTGSTSSGARPGTAANTCPNGSSTCGATLPSRRWPAGTEL